MTSVVGGFTLMRSHRRIVSDIREIASAQMLSQV